MRSAPAGDPVRDGCIVASVPRANEPGEPFLLSPLLWTGGPLLLSCPSTVLPPVLRVLVPIPFARIQKCDRIGEPSPSCLFESSVRPRQTRVLTRNVSDSTGEALQPWTAGSLDEAWRYLERERRIELWMEGRAWGVTSHQDDPSIIRSLTHPPRGLG